MKKIKLLLLLLSACIAESKAQISPPGLGLAHTADWFAVGIRQKLNRRKSWQSMSYIGIGRKSNPSDYDPVLKSAIVVLNEELYHTINSHFQYSFALSYRRQDEYMDVSPYKHQHPGIQQEFRTYGRFYYFLPLGNRFKLAAISRQELRKFYTPAFDNPDENFQFRSRWRIQATMSLNKQKTQKIIASSEALLAASHKTGSNSWTPFAYEESRFTLYYSLSLSRLPLTIDIGYMNNILGKSNPSMVHYLALDVILESPFH